MNEEKKSRGGLSKISPERRSEISRKGGIAAHAQGTAHEFTSQEAREAGRKGGEVVSRDREHMAEMGRKGGIASAIARRRVRS